MSPSRLHRRCRGLSLFSLAVALIGAMLLMPALVRAGEFVFINRGEVGTLDPNRMSWLQDIRLGYALWEGLYALDPVTLDPVPGVAERVDQSDDKIVYIFHLRESAKWSNGDPVRAGDFIFAWRRMLEEPGDYTYLFDYVKGAKAYVAEFGKGASPDFSTVGIESPDERTLRVTLNHPVTFLPDLLAFPPFFPLHEASMKAFRQAAAAGRTSYDEKWTRPPNLVTNGPFRLVSWEFKRTMRLEKSPHYWDVANVRSDAIVQLSAEDPRAAFLRYEQGDVDWLAEITGTIAADLREQGRSDLKVFPGFGTYFYSVNCQEKLPGGAANPFADVRVRRAFSMALNREPIVRNITRLGEQPALHFVPPGVFSGYQSPGPAAYDVTGARALLAEAGFPDGRGFPKVTLLYNTEGHHGDVAQYASKNWAKNLGITVELEGVEIKTFRERLHNKDYDLARASWIGDYNDVSTFTDKYLSWSLNNDSGWVNAEYDRLCMAGSPEPDVARRLGLLSEAEAILLGELPIIPVYHYVNAYLIRDGVEGIPLHPRNMINFKGVKGRK